MTGIIIFTSTNTDNLLWKIDVIVIEFINQIYHKAFPLLS